MKKVDIIIPGYNSHKTIERALASILMQTVVDDIRVLLVNDAGENYNNIVESFSRTSLEIIELDYRDNGGPSKARNFGLDNATAEYVMFLDSDDCFSCPWSVAELLRVMESDKRLKIVTSSFIEERINGTLKQHDMGLTFMHGKIYRRSHIEKYKIRFNEETRSCEDLGFNMLVMLTLVKDSELSANTDFVTYYWMNNDSSIGRNNKAVYDNSICVQGYIDNLIYLYDQLAKRKINGENIFRERITSLIRAIENFACAAFRKPEYLEENKEHLIQLYNKVYKPYCSSVKMEEIRQKYQNIPDEEKELNFKVITDVFEALATDPAKISINYLLQAQLQGEIDDNSKSVG